MNEFIIGGLISLLISMVSYLSEDWINEQYTYTIFGMLSTRTSPVVVGKISKMVDIEASFMEGTEKVGLHQDTGLFLKRFILNKVH